MCICACVHVWICVYACVCAYVREFVCLYAQTHELTYIRKHTRAQTHIHIRAILCVVCTYMVVYAYARHVRRSVGEGGGRDPHFSAWGTT